MPGPDVLGPAEARALIGCERRWFAVLSSRDDFPDATDLEIGRVWDRAEVLAWKQDRMPGGRRAHERGRRTTVLRSFRQTGNITQAARAADVARTTARRWLVDLGVLD